jgi:glycosyltransferase involved in cell wall biosynthesis
MANRFLGHFPDRICAVSNELKAHLVAEGFRRESVEVIYNGIDIGPLPSPELRATIRSQLGVSDDVLVIGTIGRLDPVKDIEMLLNAVGQLPEALPILVVVVGDGAERARLEQSAKRLTAHRQVRFLGHRDDARQWLAGFDVYVNSSISEGVSLTILEAMAAGLPIVATQVGGTPEVVNESCGRLIPARNPSGLAEVLLMLGDNPECRRTLGRQARERVESHFTVERMVDQYRTIYARLT